MLFDELLRLSLLKRRSGGRFFLVRDVRYNRSVFASGKSLTALGSR
jgi:hypothetical protein